MARTKCTVTKVSCTPFITTEDDPEKGELEGLGEFLALCAFLAACLLLQGC